MKLKTPQTARVEPNETAEVAFALDKGDQVHVTGKSSKIPNYIRYAGNPLKINPDGTLSNKICGADPICVRQFNEYKRTVIDVQDERDWWPVRNSEGQTGWIPDDVFFVRQDEPLYADSTGSEPVENGTVTNGEEVRRIIDANTVWYPVQVNDTTAGWVQADLVTANEQFIPTEAGQVFKDMNASSEVVGEVSEGQQLRLAEQKTITWYNIVANPQSEDGSTAELVSGWVNIEAQEISQIQVFNTSADTDIYAELGGQGEVLQSVKAGDELILLQTDTSTETTWYQVSTADGAVTGWVSVTPTNLSDVDVLSLPDDSPVYESNSTDSTVLATLPKKERVRVSEHNTDKDVTWNRVTTTDRQTGWTTANGRIETRFTAADDGAVFAQVGGAGDTLVEFKKDDPLTITDPTPTTFTRYQVRKADGTIGWIDNNPRTVITTRRNVVLYSFDYAWRNFKRVFVRKDTLTGNNTWGRLLQTQNSTFPRLMRTTIAWTSLNVIFHLIMGMMLALMLNRPGLRLRGLYRAIIILPWAIPQPIIALAWKGEFHYQYGFVNTLLTTIGLDRVNWLYTPTPAFIAVTFVNIWLGIPFYMVTLLGGLQSIAGEYYEAAEIDGANPWQRFRHVTIPLIRPVAVPIVTLDVIWTFNNFNVIYLITKGEPNESTNILVTALYNAAFGENGQVQLGFAAAFSLVIFAILFLFASVWVTSSGALKGVYEA